MKNYRLRLQLNAPSKIENVVSKIIEAGQALGFAFEGNADRSLSVNEAIETTLQEEYINFIIDDAAFVFYLSSISFVASGYASKWKKHFKCVYLPDNIKALNLLLDLTNDLIVKSLRISSYLELLSIPSKKNTIMVNSFVHVKESNEKLSDGQELFFRALEHNYEFIFDPRKEQDIFNPSIPILEAFEALDTMKAEETYELYLMVDNYIALLEIAPETISIVAQEPIKLKIVDGQQDYDRAFYIRILLNLLKNIGIDELICTL